MIKIELSGKVGKGKFILADDDCAYLGAYKWHNEHGYASRKIYTKDEKKGFKLVYFHRLVIDCPDDKKIDHINGNGLDNRKCNLRIATHQENIFHCKTRKDNTSGYKGVYYSKSGKRIKRWASNIMVNQKTIFLGRHLTKEDAARAYNEAAKEYFGKFAVFNQI